MAKKFHWWKTALEKLHETYHENILVFKNRIILKAYYVFFSLNKQIIIFLCKEIEKTESDFLLKRHQPFQWFHLKFELRIF